MSKTKMAPIPHSSVSRKYTA